MRFSQNPLSADQLGNLIDLVQTKKITGEYLSLNSQAVNSNTVACRDRRKKNFAVHRENPNSEDALEASKRPISIVR